mgnify:CR=1 FL=1
MKIKIIYVRRFISEFDLVRTEILWYLKYLCTMKQILRTGIVGVVLTFHVEREWKYNIYKLYRDK